MQDQLNSYALFRLNFEHQRKRAKELLKAARAGAPEVVTRFHSQPRLAEAQYLIARDLRFKSWAALKRHIGVMAREREAAENRSNTAPDGTMRTLHVRCGADIKAPLLAAGFQGDFYEHSYPYLIGPAREGKGSLEQRAHFLVDSYADSFEPPLRYEEVLDGLEREEHRLHASADYERVVIWSEFDCYDQLTLVRLLAHYATHRGPPRLELINVGEFPGATRFIGLGQLPPEALRLLWAKRKLATPAVLKLGHETWRALINPDPRRLATIMRGGARALPLLGKALHRHLSELPSIANGLSFTEAMALQLLAEGDLNLLQLIGRQVFERDPLPGQGDFQVRDRVLGMENAAARVFDRRAGAGPDGQSRPPWTDILSITDIGRAVLKGELDFMSLTLSKRWIGGVQIGVGLPDWRWDAEAGDVQLVTR